MFRGRSRVLRRFLLPENVDAQTSSVCRRNLRLKNWFSFQILGWLLMWGVPGQAKTRALLPAFTGHEDEFPSSTLCLTLMVGRAP